MAPLLGGLLVLSACATPDEKPIGQQMREQIKGWGGTPSVRTDVYVRRVPWEYKWIKGKKKKDSS